MVHRKFGSGQNLGLRKNSQKNKKSEKTYPLYTFVAVHDLSFPHHGFLTDEISPLTKTLPDIRLSDLGHTTRFESVEILDTRSEIPDIRHTRNNYQILDCGDMWYEIWDVPNIWVSEILGVSKNRVSEKIPKNSQKVENRPPYILS